MEYINKENPVYISYAWNNSSQPDLENDVDALCAEMEKNGIYYKRDKENLCPYRWNINKAEEEIGQGCAVIIVISDKYIRSLHCMHEWHLIKDNGKIWERVFPVVLSNADISNKAKYKEYVEFFMKRKKELEEQQSEGIIPLTNAEVDAVRYRYYVDDLADMYQYLADYNRSWKSVNGNNYSVIIKQLIAHVKQYGAKSKTEISSSTPSKPTTTGKSTNSKTKQKNETKEQNDSRIVYDVITKAQTKALQKNLNATRNAFLEDEKKNQNGKAAKFFLKQFDHPLTEDGIYDKATETAVLALQKYLNDKNYDSLELDGKYGPMTEHAYDMWAKKANPEANKRVLE